MAGTSLQNIAIGSVVFIFITIFAGAFILTNISNYDVPIDNDIKNITIFEKHKTSLEEYKDDVEDTTISSEVGDSDEEFVGATLGSINQLLTIRSKVKYILGDIKIFFNRIIPDQVINMIEIILGIVFITIIIVALWRYSGGIQK